jgi:hypothetical protein
MRTIIPFMLLTIALANPAAEAVTFLPAEFEGVVTLHREGDP